jgi:hypothetical protein
MPNRYEIEVKFHEGNANQAQQQNFYEFRRIYEPTVIGHKERETSTICISSESELTREGLAKILGDDIPVLSFNQLE